jgi:hypothetical protein
VQITANFDTGKEIPVVRDAQQILGWVCRTWLAETVCNRKQG